MSENKTVISSASLGVNGATLAAERTTNAIHTKGATNLGIVFKATRDAYTALHFAVDWFTDAACATALEFEGSNAAQDGTNTLETFLPYKATRTTSASINGIFSVPCLAPFALIRVSATAGGASDLISLEAVLIMS